MKRQLLPLAAIAAALALASCGKSIDTMIDEYNYMDEGGSGGGDDSGGGSGGVKQVGPDPKTHKWNMLKPSYTVTLDGSLQLAAPDFGCIDWTWTLRTWDDKVLVPFKPYFLEDSPHYSEDAKAVWSGAGTDLRRININLPDKENKNLRVGIYALTLQVTGVDLLPYDDTAAICVYPRYDD